MITTLAKEQIKNNWPGGITGRGVRFPESKLDEIGARYGRLVVVSYAYQNKHTAWVVFCECDCGATTLASISSLKKGHTRSCGCLNDDTRKEVIKKAKKAQLKKWTLEYTEGLSKRLYSNYKSSAKSRGLDFLITYKHFNETAKSNCFYCGNAPSIRINTEKRMMYCGKEFITNGVDRKDSSIGYVDGNIVACCPMCNRMKNSYGLSAFISKCKKIANRF